MVAGDGDHRGDEPVEELARRGEFLPPRALREIAADGDEIGLLRRKIGEQGFGDQRIVTAEMQIGDVRDGSHVACSCGTRTRSAPGRMR